MKEEEKIEAITKVVAEQRCQRLSGKDNIYTSSWLEQNKGYIQRSDLAEIRKEEQINCLNQEIKDCIQSGLNVLILSHNCTRSWNPIVIG